MPKLIKDGVIAEDNWLLVREEINLELLQHLRGRNLIVPLQAWQEQQELINGHDAAVAVWLDSHELPAQIADDLETLPLIALNFPGFADGRAYSNARELRQNMNYEGEIRAIGDVLRDQLFYMARCGFDAFALRDDQDVEEALKAFADFKDSYQAAVDQPLPLFRRRSA